MQCPEIFDPRRMALSFRSALEAETSAQLRQWIQATKRCEFGALVRFAYGLQKDISAGEHLLSRCAASSLTAFGVALRCPPVPRSAE